MLPATGLVPNCVDVPAHTLRLVPAFVAGNGFTITMTLFDFLQPVDVTVSVSANVVVAAGETEMEDEVEVVPVGLEVQA